MRLCVIPARGGSKRIPRKNIKEFFGKPMIAWSIEAAKKSECFDRIIVSTDDEEIATVSQKYGADVPFLRPKCLADDYAGTTPVIAHAIKWQNEHGEETSEACCLYATAPFVHVGDLQKGLALLVETKSDYAFSVTSYSFPIQRAVRITKDNRVEMFQPEYFNSRSQDLEQAWHDAGQFYWGRSESWLSEKKIFREFSIPIPIPRYRVQDIDTQEDWDRAVLLFKAIKTS
jgi:pseudaminic acid cytidylyltransferase